MTENTATQTSDSFLQQRHWLRLLAGGLLTGGAIGWSAYKGVNSQQLDRKTITTIVASFAGGIGSMIVFMSQKSRNSRRKSATSKKGASNLTAPDSEITSHTDTSDSAAPDSGINTPLEPSDSTSPEFQTSLCDRFVNLIDELDRRFAIEAGKNMEGKGLDKKISRSAIQEAAEIPRESEDMTKRLNDLNRQKPRNEQQKLSSENEMETFYNERIGNRKLELRNEIVSYINELKGYFQGAIDPFPSTRNFQLLSAEMSDEMRRQIVMIIKEFANGIQPKLEKVIDEFVESIGKAGEVLNSDREHNVKKAFETLSVPKKDLSTTASLMREMDQYSNALENATKSKSQTSECRRPEMPKLPTLLMAKGVDKPIHRAVEKLKSPQSKNPPVKLFLNREQMKCLNILKSEL